MQFVLKGFTESLGYRVFAFDSIGPDHSRKPIAIRADLALVRQYKIQLQDLPALCRDVLSALENPEENRAITCPEEAMKMHADKASAARANHRKPPRRPAPAAEATD